MTLLLLVNRLYGAGLCDVDYSWRCWECVQCYSALHSEITLFSSLLIETITVCVDLKNISESFVYILVLDLHLCVMHLTAVTHLTALKNWLQIYKGFLAFTICLH